MKHLRIVVESPASPGLLLWQHLQEYLAANRETQLSQNKSSPLTPGSFSVSEAEPGLKLEGVHQLLYGLRLCPAPHLLDLLVHRRTESIVVEHANRNAALLE